MNSKTNKQNFKSILYLLLILGFSCCYMTWGVNQTAFVFQVEYLVFTEKDHITSNFSNPLILAGSLAQLILVLAIFHLIKNKYVIMFAIGMLDIIVLLILLAGLLTVNWKIIISTLPPICFSVMLYKELYNTKLT